MANQSVRQAARRSALDAQARMRSERAEPPAARSDSPSELLPLTHVPKT